MLVTSIAYFYQSFNIS